MSSREAGIASLVTAPLYAHECHLGTLTAFRSAGQPPFGLDHNKVCAGIAKRLALAMEAVDLHHAQSEEALVEGALAEAGKELIAALGGKSLSRRQLPSSRGSRSPGSDTGIGIPADSLDDIFESFRQLEPSMTRRHGGVGLGLYLAERLTDMLGGAVSVESEVGRASKFRLTLPRAPRADGRGAPKVGGAHRVAGGGSGHDGGRRLGK